MELVPIKTLFLYTSYCVTATLSVDAFQKSLSEVSAILEASRFNGVDGGILSDPDDLA